MDKSGGRIGYGCDIEPNRPTVGGNKFTNRGANFANTERIHPTVEKDSQCPILGFVGELRAFAPVNDMIHSRQGKNAANFRRAVGHTKESIPALEFPGSLEDQPEDSRSDIGHILEIAA
jgi:hypothetical protein